MAGFSSRDGRLHGNRQTVERYDETRGHKPQRPGARGGESGGAHESSGHDEIKQVVAEHGPAHTHMISHLGGGRYHSTTHHEDGHVHHADHESLQDAHEHGAHAMDDAEHLGSMDHDDEQVAAEHDKAEGAGGMAGSDVGFMK